jgi:hypothetical protein
MPAFLIPIIVLAGILVLFGILVLLSRFRGGRYLRPVFLAMAKVPLLRRGLRKMSESALERSNPALASAMKKLERVGATRDPQRMQKAISGLTATERRAWIEASGEQGLDPDTVNRQMRRQLERQGVGKPKSKSKGKGKQRRR